MTRIGYALAIERCVDAGFDHVHVHQVDPGQEGFIDFAAKELLGAIAPAARV